MSSVSIEYARSLFELSNGIDEKIIMKNNLDESLKVFNSDIYKIFVSPEIKKDLKKDIINKSFPNGLFKNFLFVLVDNDRLNILSSIKEDYEILLNEVLKITDVIVYSKDYLSKEYMDSLKEKMIKRIGNEVNLKNEIDKTIIGGIRISYDSKEIDLTVNNKFDSLISSLKE